ncbi:MAG: hypothetical protein OXR84_17060 [Magnetovibrio sp.]|nr:hypothetical protein [Magnetovibrio sp.]
MNQIASHAAATVPAQSLAGVTAPLHFIRRQRRKPAFLSAALTGGAPELLFDTEARATACPSTARGSSWSRRPQRSPISTTTRPSRPSTTPRSRTF